MIGKFGIAAVALVAANAASATISNLAPASGANQVEFYMPLGQSFTAVDSQLGTIGFAFQVFNSSYGEVSITISLLSGDGVGGALIAQRSITPSGGSFGNRVLSFANFGGAPLTVGAAYTALISTSNPYWGIERTGDTYAGGKGYLTFAGITSSPGDYAFLINGAAAVPEPASWALLIAGFGMTGAAMRRRKAAIAA